MNKKSDMSRSRRSSPATFDAMAALLQARASQPVPRLTLAPQEAADALGVSRDFFDDHVKPELRVVRRGRLVLIPWNELERWINENAVRVLDSAA